MSKLRKAITAIVMVLALAAVVIAAYWAVKQTQDNIALVKDTQAQNACNELDSRDQVQQEMTAKAELLAQIGQVGGGARVRMALPCEGEDKARIEIYVHSKDDKAAVEEMIAQQPLAVSYEIKII